MLVNIAAAWHNLSLFLGGGWGVGAYAGRGAGVADDFVHP